MSKRIRIIWVGFFVFLVVGFLSQQLWQKSFHLKTLVSDGKTAYEPGFYYATPNGMIFGKSAFRQIVENKLRKGNGKYLKGYRGGYPQKAEEELSQYGYGDFYGQLLFYHNYPNRKIYIYDNWYEHESEWKIFIIEDEEIKELDIDKSDYFDGVTDCTADADFLYLHIYGGHDDLIVIQIEIKTGIQKKYTVTREAFDLISNSINWFDPRTEQLMVFAYNGNQKELQAHSFRTGKTKTVPLTKLASWVLASEDGYLLANASPGRIVFYAYDLDWNPTPEKDIEIPLINIVDIRRFKPLASYEGDEMVHLVDGIAYGCIEGEEALWYYAVDLEAQKVVALWEIRPPKGDLRLRDHILFHKETGCEPYPTLF